MSGSGRADDEVGRAAIMAVVMVLALLAGLCLYVVVT